MAKNKLKALDVENAKDGVLFDGEGLYLRVSGGGTRKSWVLRFTFYGKRIDLGLGSTKLLSLAKARKEAQRLREDALLGKDPRLDARFVQPVEAPAEPAPGAEPAAPVALVVVEEEKGLTFAKAVDKFLAFKTKEFENDKHVAQWRSTLQTYAVAPKDAKGHDVKGLGTMLVAKIEMEDVKRILEPIWETKTETASRLRGRIEAVLSWATAMKHRRGENPARWKGNLDAVMPKPNKLKDVKHHDALPWKQLPEFITDLSKREGVSARCLAFLILTATRSGEAREARWSEFDLKEGIWTIPAERMKMRVEHRVPLTSQALAVLEQVKGLDTDLVFPSPMRGKTAKAAPMDYNAFTALFKRMGVVDVTAHGFRSTFRDWASDSARAQREVAESVLAHSLGSGVEKAYARSDLFDRRAELMAQWADYAYSGKSKP